MLPITSYVKEMQAQWEQLVVMCFLPGVHDKSIAPWSQILTGSGTLTLKEVYPRHLWVACELSKSHPMASTKSSALVGSNFKVGSSCGGRGGTCDGRSGG